MSAYLFAHFREKTTPDGEQVYFGISRDGFHWEAVNDGKPVLWSYVGTKGVRDFTIVRHPKTGRIYIVATDLSVSYGCRLYRPEFWSKVGTQGSTGLVIWESDDLVHWTESRLADMGSCFGCVWAPDAIWDEEKQAFMLHWSSSWSYDDYKSKRIIYTYTADFEHFTEPKVLHEEERSEIIDSAVYAKAGKYYMFGKAGEVCSIRMYEADTITGPYRRMDCFDRCVGDVIERGLYEAPTAVELDDGRYCLFLDYYGVPGAGQGYVPFVSEDITTGIFRRADEEFSFPYGYKHGTILKITDEEYARIRDYDWSDKGYPSGWFW
ncbi:MAG: glycoside hydrolase family 43 protein [Clostridia bacterium]|nr:glycoside hydrolase family 43 protein [Clostridia bacterium]